MLHAFVSDAMEQGDGQSGIITNQVKGLDKLVEQGFNHDEIRALRFHFHAMCILKYEDYNPKTEEIRLSLEEKWLNGQLADFNLSPEETCQYELQMVPVTQITKHGTGMDFVWGTVYGMMLSLGFLFMMRFWTLNPMQKRGAWFGLTLSLLLFALVILSLCSSLS